MMKLSKEVEREMLDHAQTKAAFNDETCRRISAEKTLFEYQVQYAELLKTYQDCKKSLMERTKSQMTHLDCNRSINHLKEENSSLRLQWKIASLENRLHSEVNFASS